MGWSELKFFVERYSPSYSDFNQRNNMSKEAKKEVVVCDGKDQDNITDFVYISSVYQGGPKKEGHYLKFLEKQKGGSKELITAAKDKDKSKIKLEIFPVNADYQLCLITDPNQAGCALKSNFKDAGTSSFTVEQNSDLAVAIKSKESYNRVIKETENFHDFVFKKKEAKKNHDGSPYYYLYSYKHTSHEESLVLAVDEKGELRMDSPPKLQEALLENHDDIKYLFRIVEV